MVSAGGAWGGAKQVAHQQADHIMRVIARTVMRHKSPALMRIFVAMLSCPGRIRATVGAIFFHEAMQEAYQTCLYWV